MSHLTINRAFAENLGLAYGDSVNTQSHGAFGRFFVRDGARACGFRLNPFPFFGAARKNEFKAYWMAGLQGIGTWSAVNALPEFAADQKLVAKTVFFMEQYVDSAFKEKVFSRLTPAQTQTYEKIRRDMIRIGQVKSHTMEDLARMFIADLYDMDPAEVKEKRIAALVEHIKSSDHLFRHLAELNRKDKDAYKRVPRKAVTAA